MIKIRPKLSPKLIAEINNYVDKLNIGDQFSVDQLYNKEWNSIVAARLGGWMGHQLKLYSELKDSRIECLGMQKRSSPPHRYTLAYKRIK